MGTKKICIFSSMNSTWYTHWNYALPKWKNELKFWFFISTTAIDKYRKIASTKRIQCIYCWWLFSCRKIPSNNPIDEHRDEWPAFNWCNTIFSSTLSFLIKIKMNLHALSTLSCDTVDCRVDLLCYCLCHDITQQWSNQAIFVVVI